MVGETDVTNGVRERRGLGGERRWKGNKSISNRDFRGELFRRWRWRCLTNRISGISAYGSDDIEERKDKIREKAKEENQT